MFRSSSVSSPLRLSAVNSNALVALEALLRLRSVTLASKELGVTQSTLSGTLARLRDLLGDKLLVRDGRTMVLTPRAQTLLPDLRRGVEALERVLVERGFDPDTSQQDFVLALNDRAEQMFLRGLVARLRELAPGVSLQTVPWGRFETPPGLADGSVDASIQISVPKGLGRDWPSGPRLEGAGVRSRVLVDSGLTSIVRADHPRIGKRLTLAAFCDVEHVLVTEQPRGMGIIDDALAQLGRSRRVALRVPRHALVAELVAHSDLLATIGRRPAAEAARRFGLRTFKPPVAVPNAAFTMFWHESTEDDPARAWLRAQVGEVAAELD